MYESSKAVRLMGRRFANINIEVVGTDLKERVMSLNIVLWTDKKFFVTYFFIKTHYKRKSVPEFNHW